MQDILLSALVKWKNAFLDSPWFGITLSIAALQLGIWVHRKIRLPFMNHLLYALIFCWAVMLGFRIPFSAYNKGAAYITFLFGPATAILAVFIYKQIDALKANILPILAGIFVGSAVCVTSILVMAKLFGLDHEITVSLLPKSVTAPIGVELARTHGGLPSVTFAGIAITGNLGYLASPLFIKLFRVKNPVAAGLAIGTCSHAMGTSRALEIGDAEAAMSSLAIGVAGVITIVLMTVLSIWGW